MVGQLPIRRPLANAIKNQPVSNRRNDIHRVKVLSALYYKLPMTYWRSFLHQGVKYELTHLHPKVMKYERAARNDLPAITYSVNVRFGLHCFTCGTDEPGLKDDPSLAYSDSKETRQFDHDRYALSKKLPDIIENLPKRKCYHTDRGTFSTIEMLNDGGVRRDYEIYFTIYKSAEDVLHLLVITAYPRDAKHNAGQARRKNIRFLVVLFNAMNNKTTNPPP